MARLAKNFLEENCTPPKVHSRLQTTSLKIPKFWTIFRISSMNNNSLTFANTNRKDSVVPKS